MKKILSILFGFIFLLFVTSCDNEVEVKNEVETLSCPEITLNNNIVSWEAVENADGYVVLKNSVEQAIQTTTTYTISDTDAGDYLVQVKAVSRDKTKFKDSLYSNHVIYTIKSTELEQPSIPQEPVGPVIKLEEATLYAVGDSTVSNFSDAYYYPRYGYGTQLSNYFDTKLTVTNLALSGRSSKNFTSEANYLLLKNNIKQGDYLLIGFGHNDEKSDDAERFTDASKPITDPTSFKYSLYENYIKLAEDKGATPILCTPIVRADTSNNYSGNSGHITNKGDYAKAIIELGEEKNVTVIDLTALTKAKYSELGYDEARYYHAMTTGEFVEGSTTETKANLNSVDKTHLNIYGAKYVAYLVAKELKKSDNYLGNYVLSDIKEPTKANDLVSNSSYIVPTYKAPELSTYKAPSHFTTITEGWYGTAFGECQSEPLKASNGFVAKETSEGIFEVGQNGAKTLGKFSGTTDGFAFVFKQVDISKNFEITAEAKVIKTASVKQTGFGLMLRDDSYINQAEKLVTINSNFVAAGFLTNENDTNILFSRSSAGALTKENNKFTGFFAENDTAKLKIVRVGQSITTTVEYKDKIYTKNYLDFDLVAMDNNYMYVGMFANRGTIIEFTNVSFTITGESQGA